MNPKLSVIIVTYNAEQFLKETLKSVLKQKGISLELIIVDNNSSDNSKELVSTHFPAVTWVERDTSIGFSAGNNLGIKHAAADTILFLNPDVQLESEYDLLTCYNKIHSDPRIGALTPRVNLVLTGKVDETCHRGFPTPWASLTHFLGFGSLFPKSKLFAQYTKSYLGYDQEHEVDAVGGMFMLMRRAVGESVGWWDEDYPLYGEDLDFCYRLHEAGYKNIFFPKVTVLHYKGVSTGMSKHSRAVTTATRQTTHRVRAWSIKAMELFYDKHYTSKYPAPLTWLVKFGIKCLYFVRVTLASLI